MLILDIYLFIGVLLGIGIIYLLDNKPNLLIERGMAKEDIDTIKRDFETAPASKLLFIAMSAIGWLPMLVIPAHWVFK